MTRAGVCALALGLALVLGGCATTGPSATHAPARYEDGGQVGDASYFRDALSPYGRWVELDPYGLCWLPDGLGPGWSPYSQGFWTYSDYGWTWVDEEPWGWAPFHYGRWWLDPQYGWVWIPGTEWAPAWVAWREGDAYVAWAPLPPTIHWSLDVPLNSGGASVAALPDSWWNVARPEDLGGTNARVPLVGALDKTLALARTQDRTRIVARANRPFNEGVSVSWIESRVGRPLPRLQVVDAPTPGTARAGGVEGGTVALYRPLLRGRPPRAVGRPGLRERPPAASVVPAPAPAPGVPASPAPSPAPSLLRGGLVTPRRVAPAASSADSLRLETFLDSERKRLLHDQEQDKKHAASSDAEALGVRHAAEQKMFEGWAERQRAGLKAGHALHMTRFDRRSIVQRLHGEAGDKAAAPDSTRGGR